MATLALAPSRFAPASTIFCASAVVRTPPLAFTPTSSPTTARMSATSAAGEPRAGPDVGRVHAHRRKPVAARLVAELDQIVAGGVGLEQRVIDVGRQVLAGADGGGRQARRADVEELARAASHQLLAGCAAVDVAFFRLLGGSGAGRLLAAGARKIRPQPPQRLLGDDRPELVVP